MSGPESITRRAFRSLLWVSSGMGILTVLRIVNLMVLARLLGPETFGLMSAAFVVVGLSYVISDLGMSYALIQRPAITQRDISTAMTISLVTGALLYLGVWVTADLVGSFFNQPRLPEILRILGLVFPLRSLSVPADAVLQRNLDFATVSRIDVAAYGIGYFAVSITLALMGYEIWALGGAFLGETLVRTALLVWVSPYRLRPGLDRAAVRGFLRFGSAVSLTRLANFAALQVDKVIVGRLLGTTILGAYERAYTLMVMPANVLGQVVGRVLFPALSLIQDNQEVLRLNYRRSLALTALFTVPLSVLVVLLDRQLVELFLGPGWNDAVVAFEILGSVLVFRASYKVSGELVHACGAVVAEAWRQVLYAVAVLAGGLLGARWGLAGVSLGVSAAIVLNWVLMTRLAMGLTGLGTVELLAAHVPSLWAGLLTTAGAWGAWQLLPSLGMPPVITAGLSGIAGLVTAAAVMLAWPRLMGPDAAWLLRVVRDALPDAPAALIDRLLARVPPAGP